jgi:hypothetical protein
VTTISPEPGSGVGWSQKTSPSSEVERGGVVVDVCVVVDIGGVTVVAAGKAVDDGIPAPPVS